MEGVIQGTVFILNSSGRPMPRLGGGGGGRYVSDSLPDTAVRIRNVAVTVVSRGTLRSRQLRTRTDFHGEFRLIRVPQGLYEVVFRHDDFQEHKVEVLVAPPPVVLINAGLTPTK